MALWEICFWAGIVLASIGGAMLAAIEALVLLDSRETRKGL